ncbi:PREDICTED: sodium channel protein Nach-like [Papilio polytes]|uniref:sodium channel protein Nach-like n=1 Tax=Papilio polytes TaxID=76194 RepID=UPI000675D8C2|nr:PREDICTED: sodium channel protein Nach-like [Papilio polytes]
MQSNSDPSFASTYRRYQRRLAKQTDLEILKESVKTVGKDYCAESSISGLKHLVNDNTSFLERIIWIIIMISALICSVSLVWLTFRKYYSAPLVTTQMPAGVSVSKIIFPAVGICSNNRISKRAITELARKLVKEERNKMYDEEGMLSLLVGLGLLYNIDPVDDEVVKPMQLHRALGVYDVNELMRNLQFSDAYDFPDAPSGSFSMQIISPNVQMTVLVTASFTEASRDIQHVPVKLRQCLFYDESQYLPFYTHSDCMLKCRMSFLLANCNCTPFNMPKMPNTRTCDMRDVPCLRIYNGKIIENLITAL